MRQDSAEEAENMSKLLVRLNSSHTPAYRPPKFKVWHFRRYGLG